MRQSNTRIFGVLVAIAMLAVMVCAGAPPVRAGAATRGRPGTLDPSFGHDGVTRARSTAEHASSEFGAAAAAPGGDLFLELKRKVVGDEEVREIEARTPTGALDPSFGSEGKLTVARGAGLVALPDGDLAIGVEACGGQKGSVGMVDPRGTRVATFGDDGCGAPAPGRSSWDRARRQGTHPRTRDGHVLPPCYHDVPPIRKPSSPVYCPMVVATRASARAAPSAPTRTITWGAEATTTVPKNRSGWRRPPTATS